MSDLSNLFNTRPLLHSSFLFYKLYVVLHKINLFLLVSFFLHIVESGFRLLYVRYKGLLPCSFCSCFYNYPSRSNLSTLDRVDPIFFLFLFLGAGVFEGRRNRPVVGCSWRLLLTAVYLILEQVIFKFEVGNAPLTISTSVIYTDCPGRERTAACQALGQPTVPFV